MKRTRWNGSGFTLLEVLVFMALFALVMTATLRVIGDANMMRGAAKERGQLLALAQEQLDAARLVPADELEDGEKVLEIEAWSPEVRVTRRVTQRTDGHWEIAIVATRQLSEGLRPVVLTTVVPASTKEGGA